MGMVSGKRIAVWVVTALVALAIAPSMAFAATMTTGTLSPAADSDVAFTVYARVGDGTVGEDQVVKDLKVVKKYTKAELQALAKKNSGKIGFLANAKSMKVFATNSYIPLKDLIADAGFTLTSNDSVNFIDGTLYGAAEQKLYSKKGFEKVTTADLNADKKFFPAYSAAEPTNASNARSVPTVIALSMNEAEVGASTAQAAFDSISDYNENSTPRLLHGVTESAFLAGTVTQGNQTPSGITGIVFNTTSLENATVEGLGDAEYTGNAIKPSVKVTMPDGTLLKEGFDYRVSYGKNTTVKDGGKVTLTGMGTYANQVKTKTFKVTRASNSVAKTVSLKVGKKKVAKKAQKLLVPGTFGAAKVTKVISPNKKGVLSVKGGKIVVKKGAKKGTYAIKVKIGAIKATSDYAGVKGGKTVNVKVAVK